MGVPGL